MWHRFVVWWRGWDECDLLSAKEKLHNVCAPGSGIQITAREMAAMPEIWRRDKIEKEYEMIARIIGSR